MAFVPTLADDTDYVHVHRDGNAFRVSTQIGYDDDTQHVYYLAIMLDVVPAWGYELRYCIEEYNAETEEFNAYWDRGEVRSFIGRNDRIRVLGSLFSIVKKLVSLAQPDAITIVINDDGQAMARKDTMLLQVIESCGYDIVISDSYYGRRRVRLERCQGEP
ncbi:hypothetical protein [Rhodomicrobium lacus]|uniref:hypothetical protein n=1 Tax=Rhodomicrobium lacus TaxID=2498452 RepID=UPI000F8CBD57|nr:hypothetical protein [Rhodomicrobium lacus]